ncbi:MAG: ABC transporter permease [Actinomycetota bacterium]|nr:ABC transporter permease [Actinomycetota bacterium]
MSAIQASEILAETPLRDEESGGSIRQEAWRRLRRNPAAIAGFVLIALFVAVAALAPLLAPYDPVAQVRLRDIRPGLIPGPSGEHLLGVDALGRDELSRLLFGARQSLLIGVGSTVIGFAAGGLLGVLAGGFGGWVDGLVMRIVDIMLAIPGLIFAIGVAALLGKNRLALMIAIAVPAVPIFARLLRGSMLSQRGRDYVLASTSLGVRRRNVVLGHVLPNSLSAVLVQGTLLLATAIIDAAALSFLGLGTDDPGVPEWGRMLADSQNVLAVAPHLAFLPCIAIVLSALGFTLLGESLREALDPRFRR